MRRFARIAMVCVAALAAAPAPTQTAAPAAKCADPAYRQFDYWVGEWDVYDAKGKRVGENRITRIHGGCALLEEWRGNGNVTGSSLNIYDRERGRWHQTWVDAGGGLLLLDGGIVDGAMTMTGESVEAGKRMQQRIRWTSEPDGRVRQLWEASADGGKTWSVAFDGWYVKRR